MRPGGGLTKLAAGMSAAAVALAVLVGLLAQTSSQGAAANRTTVTVQYGGWKVTCDEAGDGSPPVCSASFRVFEKSSNRTVLTWLVGRSRDAKLLTEFYVPTEVLIEPGVAMSLEDGPAYKANFVACGKTACKASLALDAALASELASATRASLSLTASNGKVTRFSMDIVGIEAALAELGN